jgi:hypothetical protein
MPFTCRWRFKIKQGILFLVKITVPVVANRASPSLQEKEAADHARRCNRMASAGRTVGVCTRKGYKVTFITVYTPSLFHRTRIEKQSWQSMVELKQIEGVYGVVMIACKSTQAFQLIMKQ